MKLKRLSACALFLALAFSLSATLATLSAAQTAPAPEFQLGFEALAVQIPDVVGAPTENEHFNPLNGNAEQRTTKGLMVWRKGDNWTAFTDGTTTWINGPAGVQSRLNIERFAWENTPVEAETRRPIAKAEPKEPVAPAALIQGSGAVATGVQISVPATQVPAPAAPTQASGPAAPAAPRPAGTSKDACLACHGSFSTIMSATADYTWPSGAKENPHQYVPHGSQTVPECTACHNTHPVPPAPADIAAIGKAQPTLCLSCHGTGF